MSEKLAEKNRSILVNELEKTDQVDQVVFKDKFQSLCEVSESENPRFPNEFNQSIRYGDISSTDLHDFSSASSNFSFLEQSRIVSDQIENNVLDKGIWEKFR